MTDQRKAVALISGGLDSQLAVRVIQEQGVYVEGINFFTGFCVEGHTHAIRKKNQTKPKRNNALWAAEQLGIKLHLVDIVDEYKQIVCDPKHGYGANLNPCLDCKVFMVKKAKEWMVEHGFDFVISGEVIGQRPMSQRKDTMPIIQEESGIGELLVRPLSARLLPETRPELEGWLERNKLYDLSGRSRKPQMALAKHFEFEDYAQPAGGCCFLTDKRYSKKLTDLWQMRGGRCYELDDMMLLKVGRHIRPAPHFKLIVAREEGEGNFLQGYRKQYPSLLPSSHRGPLTLIDGQPSKDDLELAARIVARYSQGREADQVVLEYLDCEGNANSLHVRPLSADEMPRDWVL